MSKKSMKLKVIEHEFAICKLRTLEDVDLRQQYCFLAKTDEEISYICKVESIPEDCINYKRGWIAFRIQETLDFDLVGVVAGISDILAQEQISIYSISTYNTIYMLIRKENLKEAVRVLELNGYNVGK
ncbi:ACT domain-containing protein [Bariatricus massiliensis]|uniref:ACT domain-containing protein n=1 Tax=Bariatricus massiliensis TaxID=1745713 RepID=A0ABS8DLJ4_9FIRM|nr:ACT domain-containing protein [Bariatricus massiliensis]MCB7303184.1 ACT domain-containing protein [Bariatricus massiliensis]MCB7376635.1 ACT domain-containing protein [Bariatricus massiliensis]MCB7389293.1 ACT domain-containing protein [Bariatricus massiliensis]MCB7413427.1 ACT domain-containing protein [Bariatricus massiliensis]MCQ5252058.1 ACT domain-containing protein [Bariatricus massiliensis]